MKKSLHACLSFLSEIEVRPCPKSEEVQTFRTSLNKKGVVENRAHQRKFRQLARETINSWWPQVQGCVLFSPLSGA